MKISCDVCGEPIEISKNTGIITFERSYDESGRKTLSNFNIHHKFLVTSEHCDAEFRMFKWRPLEKLTGKEE